MSQTVTNSAARGGEIASETLRDRFMHVRARTRALAEHLDPEDCVLQSMPDASPTKWHLAHTTWFFETFVLEANVPQHRAYDDAFRVLFNSYYNSVGEQYPRHQRGLISRPDLAAVMAYRRNVDAALLHAWDDLAPAVHAVIEVGLQHEQQHQELILTDILHALSFNPSHPTVRGGPVDAQEADHHAHWIRYSPGLARVGHDGTSFSFDNERPAHDVYLYPFELMSRPVTVREYLAFVEDGGYRRPELWLSSGWDQVQHEDWHAPLYWRNDSGAWTTLTLRGRRPLEFDAPVCHVSYFEADAYARWAGARLPTEHEWEHAAAGLPVSGNFADTGPWLPQPARGAGLVQMFGDVWEWTGSAYLPYPGFRIADGALGEYNGKFMSDQWVLRGGSLATPTGHMRASYRNFFPAAARWQFSGLRLARDVS
jgi:ergothioneine biosynthesis protein EgtB